MGWPNFLLLKAIVAMPVEESRCGHSDIRWGASAFPLLLMPLYDH
jgi:hypothetical protein